MISCFPSRRQRVAVATAARMGHSDWYMTKRLEVYKLPPEVCKIEQTGSSWRDIVLLNFAKDAKRHTNHLCSPPDGHPAGFCLCGGICRISRDYHDSSRESFPFTTWKRLDYRGIPWKSRSSQARQPGIEC